jgi:hypothetical protein
MEDTPNPDSGALGTPQTGPPPQTIRFELDPYGPLPANYSQVGEDEWRTEPMTLIEAVIATASERLVDHAKREGTKDHFKTLVERVRAVRDEEIREAVRPLISEALEAPIVPSNTLGERRGEETTMHELIVTEATKQLAKPAGRRRDFINPPLTILESVIAEQVNAALSKELRGALDEAKAEVIAAVREKGNEVLTEALARALPRT